MKAGTLRHWLTFEKPPVSPTRDTTGAEVEAWEPVVSVWGSIEPLVGREYVAAQQVNAELSHRIRVRYHPDFTPTMRILYGTREFNIISLLNREERNVELEIYATEKVPDAAAGS